MRGKFKSYEYQSVILPVIVIRRLECVLIDWREKRAADVLKNRPKLTEKQLAKLVKELELNPKQCPFSNKTDWTLRKVYEEDHALLEENFRAYINGFSKNVDDIIEHFNYRATIGQMVKNNRLAPILNQYKELALGPDQLSGLEMGYTYEELLRRFSEQSGEGDDYRIMVVANKFQTGFDQPLLAGMFLDKPVVDRNAVQTVSRLNRAYYSKKDVVVVDFTNNAKQILKAFMKYRKGTPFEPDEPDQDLCPKLHAKILGAGVFAQKDAVDLLNLVRSGTDAQVQFQVNALRIRFQAKLTDWEDRKAFVYLLARFAKSFHFLTCFFTYAPEIQEVAAFAEIIGPQFIKVGTVSDLMKQIRATEVSKAAVQYQGVMTSSGPVKLQPGKGKKGAGPPPVKVSVQDMITEIRARFDITDEEALYIRQVTEEKVADPGIRTTVEAHRQDWLYLEGPYRGQVNEGIQTTYDERGRYDELADPKYTDTGGIFDIMAVTVIQTHLSLAA